MNNREGSIWYSLGLDNASLQNDANRAKGIIKNIGDSVVAEGRRIDDVYNNISRGLAFAFTTGVVGGFVSQLVQVRSEFQQLEISFSTMLKSRVKAEKLMSELTNLAATTPFGLQEVSEGAKRLLAIQVSAEEVTDVLRRMGDVAAGLGVPMGQLIHVYGQVKAQGKLMTNDLYQFMNAGIPIIAELSKVTGRTQQEIKEMVSQGKIGFTEIQQVFKGLTDAGGLFHNLTAEQSKSLKGQISNLKDNIESMFNELGKSSQGFFSGAISGVSFLVENYKAIGKTLSVLVATYGSYKTALMVQAAAQQVVIRYGQYDIVTKQLQTRATIQAMLAQVKLNTAVLANPYVLAGAAIAGLVVAIWQFSDSMSEAEKAQKRFNEAYKEQADFAKNEKKEIDELIGIIKDENVLREKRIKAFDKLKSKYPEIFSKYKTEEDFLKNLTQAYKELNGAIDQQVTANWEEKLKQAEKRALLAQERLNNLSKGSGLVTVFKTKSAKEELEAAKRDAKEIKTHLQYQNVIKFEADFKDLSLADRKKQLKYIVDEMNARKQGKTNFDAYSQFSDGFLGRLHQNLKDLISSEEKINGALIKRTEIQEQIKQKQQEIAVFEAKYKNNTLTEGDQKKLETLREELKTLEEKDRKLSGDKKERATSKKNEKPKLDNEANELKIARERTDNELKAQKLHIEAMAEGYEKERALIDFHYKEKAEAIDRGLQDTIIQLKKQREDGTITARQHDELLFQANENYKLGHQQNKQVREQQNEKLYSELLKKYQDFEERKSELHRKYEEERNILTQQLENETDPVKIKKIKSALAQLKKEYSKGIDAIEKEQIGASKVFNNLFSDFEKFTNKQLNDMLSEAEKAVADLRQKLDLTNPENVKYLESLNNQIDKLKKVAQGSFGNNLKNMVEGFKTLLSNDKNITQADRLKAGNSIQTGIGEMEQLSAKMSQIFNKLGDDMQSSLMKSFAKITDGIQQGLQGLNTAIQVNSGKMSKGEGWASAIGSGVNFVVGMISEISANRRARRAQEARDERDRIQLQEDYNQKLNEEIRLSAERRKEGTGTRQYMDRLKAGMTALNHATEQQQQKIRQLMNEGRVKAGARNQTDWGAVGRDTLKGAGAGAAIGAMIGGGVFSWATAGIGAAVGAVVGFIGGLFKKKRKQEWTGILHQFPELVQQGEDGLLRVNKALLESLKANNQLDDKTLDIVNNIEKWNEQIEKANKQMEEVLGEILGDAAQRLGDELVDAFKKGENAANRVRKVVGDILADLGKQLLLDVLVAPVIEDIKKKALEGYKKDGQAGVIRALGEGIPSLIGASEAMSEGLKVYQDELKKKYNLDIYKNQYEQGKIKGLQAMTQDQASELNAKFTLGIELDRVRNVHLENITKNIAESYRFLQDVSAKQLQHLAGIEVNTYMLHNIDKEISGVKSILSDIQLKGLKMK
ncbi:tape measure protein [Capnocytophaga sp.]|uniref:tape measure protein n=1 Tax=Capnocytophaga sp. TaxID=44737 RepID=UPI0026DCFA10|nr:tape measure protein [Capnocytophaga sp.]MDO5106023.1 tape measure protein [Capnocytophaga sp.]